MPFIQSLQKSGYGVFSGRRRKLPVYVGGTSGSSAGNTASTLTINLPSGIQPGDVVVVAHVEGSTTDRSMALGTTGYTKLIDAYSNVAIGADTNLGIYYKVMGATVDSTVVLPVNASTADSRAAVVHVWRNIETNSSEIMDVSQTSSTVTGTIAPTFGLKTLSSTENAVTLLISAAASQTTPSAYTSAPSGTSNFISTFASDTNDSHIGIASYFPSLGENRAFSSFGTSINDASTSSAIAASITLRASF